MVADCGETHDMTFENFPNPRHPSQIASILLPQAFQFRYVCKWFSCEGETDVLDLFLQSYCFNFAASGFPVYVCKLFSREDVLDSFLLCL